MISATINALDNGGQIEPIDVVIVNYNSAEVLHQCLQSLLSADKDNHLNIVVVDNASDDDSMQTMKPWADQITLVKNSQNRGFASACNQGAALGNEKFIAFINPDCFVQESQLQHLIGVLNQHNKAAVVGCRVLNNDGSLQAASRRRLPTFWRVLYHISYLARFKVFKGINIQDDGHFEEPIEVEAVNGACYVINRSDFKAINGFDEAYPLHFEDLDLFTRVIKQNRKIMYDAQVEVVHLQGQAKQQSKLIKQWKKQGLKRYFSLHRPAWEAKLVNWLL